MDLLIIVIIAGFATAYLVEFLNSLLENVISGKLLRALLTVPLNTLWFYLMNLWDTTTFVTVPAASLVSAIISILINRPTVLRR